MGWKIFIGTVFFLAIAIIILSHKVPDCISIPKEEVQEPIVEYTLGEMASFKEDVEIQKEDINFIALGESMSPTIGDNSVCNCEVKKKYKKGDIIVFYVEENGLFTLVSHRIYGIVKEDGTKKFLTKGDGNNYIDPWILEKENILCSVPETRLVFILIEKLENMNRDIEIPDKWKNLKISND